MSVCNDYFNCPHCAVKVNARAARAHLCKLAPEHPIEPMQANGRQLGWEEIQKARVASGLAPSKRIAKLLKGGAR